MVARLHAVYIDICSIMAISDRADFGMLKRSPFSAARRRRNLAARSPRLACRKDDEICMPLAATVSVVVPSTRTRRMTVVRKLNYYMVATTNDLGAVCCNEAAADEFWPTGWAGGVVARRKPHELV